MSKDKICTISLKKRTAPDFVPRLLEKGSYILGEQPMKT